MQLLIHFGSEVCLQVLTLHLFFTVLASISAGSLAPTAAPVIADGPGTQAARAALDRLAPQIADRFVLQRERADAHAVDSFTISARGDRVALAGSSPVAILSAFSWYLEHVAHGQISREGVNLPATPPLPTAPIHEESAYRYRYAYNFTVFGYTAPYWNWNQWQRELDYLAASGTNMALVTVGQEAVWYDTFRDFGYSDTQMRSWISVPAHQPWQWMSNMHSYGGPLSRELIERRAALGRKIIDRMRELGITPVVPGFSGSVPPDFAKLNAGAHTIAQGPWPGFQRPDWLDTTSATYQRVAADFYKHQTARFGVVHAKAIDLLHEGGRSGGVGLTDAAQSVERAIAQADPQYLWVMQAWLENPRKPIVDGIRKQHLLIIDLKGYQWSTKDAYWGAPWVRGFLANMGGHNIMYGALPQIAALAQIRQSPQRGNIEGTAFMDEGFDRNPVVWQLNSDLAWTKRPLNLDTWLHTFVRARYGSPDPDALAAWKLLLASAYHAWDDDRLGGTESAFNQIPDVHALPADASYDPRLIAQAQRDLLHASGRLGKLDTYRYDLVDVSRQMIDEYARALLPRIATAYDARDRAKFAALSQEWLHLIDVRDALLATRKEFLLGPWVADARSWGTTPAEKDLYEWDARSILTVWGPRSSAVLQDYANRDWAGLTSTYYRARWKTYLDTLSAALATGKPPAAIDWWAVGNTWDHGHEGDALAPSGDSIHMAGEAADAIARLF
ncbi:MAG: alpha-N-acetylglucosaminidase TIM-barrel domain-containing protein [Vulcanimicrobiaceae bacterium]